MYAPDTMKPATAWPIAENFMPEFELSSSTGQTFRTSDYRNRRSLILVFAGEYSRDTSYALLLDLAKHYSEIAGERAEVLVVVRGTPKDAAQIKQRNDLPFPVLADEDGQVHRNYGAMTSDGRSASEAVYAAGRFGKVYLSSRASDGPPLPTANDILGSLHFIESQCPECGREEL
jgi:peroxiredoxin